MKNLRPNDNMFKPAKNKFEINKGRRYDSFFQKCDDCEEHIDIFQDNHKILWCKAFGKPRFGDIGCCRTVPRDKRNLKSDALIQFVSDVELYRRMT